MSENIRFLNHREGLEVLIGYRDSFNDLSRDPNIVSEPSADVRAVDEGVGQIVSSVTREYLVDVMLQKGINLKNTQEFDPSLLAALSQSQINAIARGIRREFELFNIATMQGDDAGSSEAVRKISSYTNIFHEASRDALYGLSSENADAYFRGFLAHHGLIQTTNSDGKHIFMLKLNEKVAQPGDYVPRVTSYIPL